MLGVAGAAAIAEKDDLVAVFDRCRPDIQHTDKRFRQRLANRIQDSLVCVQFLYSQDAVTSLPTSSTEPIMTTGQKAPGNIVASPITE